MRFGNTVKNRIAWMVLLCLWVTAVTGTLTGCGQTAPEEKTSLTVVSTIFPLYDWTQEVAGREDPAVRTELLVRNGVDLHSFQPTAEDIVRITDCDLFIYVGGESEAWVDTLLKNAENPQRRVLKLMDILGDRAREEEELPGLPEEKQGEEEQEYDEHVWLSLRNAELFVKEIAETLAELRPDRAETYRSNAAAYMEKLDTLDREYGKSVQEAGHKMLIFGDRFPFLYLMKDYGLDYYAAFPGCSAESEASFETIIFLAEKADELQVPALVIIDGSDQKIADSILQSSDDPDRPVLKLDSMQSVTQEEIGSGVTYLQKMENNLETLKEAIR